MTAKHPNRRLRAAALALACAAALAACGGSHHDHPHPPPAGGGGTTTPPPPVAGDSFFSLVLSRVASLLDNDEPVGIEAVTATAPENTEPEPLPAS